MKINRDSLPPEIQKANESLLDRLEKEALEKLRDPDYRYATAAHESSHFYYRKQVGAVNIRFVGPHFSYDAAKKEIHVAAAGIGSDFTKFLSFRDMARYCVAGYIWEAFLTHTKEDLGGAVIDKKIFWEDVRRFCPSVTDNQIEATWVWAEGQVRSDFENPRIRSRIERLARRFQKKLL